MPAAFTQQLSVQVSDFEGICLLIQLPRLVCDFCSSGQRFACGFLQIPPRDGHPCRPANDSPCRVRRRLSLPSRSALPGAQKQGQALDACPFPSRVSRVKNVRQECLCYSGASSTSPSAPAATKGSRIGGAVISWPPTMSGKSSRSRSRA
jgi:hypothetical protein